MKLQKKLKNLWTAIHKRLSAGKHRLLICPAPDPWSIGDIGILDNNQLANGPGIS